MKSIHDIPFELRTELSIIYLVTVLFPVRRMGVDSPDYRGVPEVLDINKGLPGELTSR